MGRTIKKIIIIILLPITFYFVVFFIQEIDNVESNYYNKNEVLEYLAIEKGWIPKIIPNSAFDILEKHNIDTNIVSGSFKYKEEDEVSFLNNLERMNNKLIWDNYEFTVNTKKNQVYFSSPLLGILQ